MIGILSKTEFKVPLAEMQKPWKFEHVTKQFTVFVYDREWMYLSQTNKDSLWHMNDVYTPTCVKLLVNW